MNVTPGFVSMIQEVLPTQRHTRHRDHSHFLGLVSRKADTDQAKTLINSMLTEVNVKIDEEHRECKKTFDDKCQMMEFLREDIDDMNAQSAASNGKVIDFEGEISDLIQ